MPALRVDAPDGAPSLELAFELARSRAFEQVGGIEEALRRAGHDVRPFEEAAFRKQLRGTMKATLNANDSVS